MEWAAKLRDEFLKQAHAGGPMALYDAVVTAVDAEAFTCDILLNEVNFYEVRLRAVISDKQSIDVLPANGSAIVVGMMGDDDFIVIACDEISMYSITVGTTVFKLDSDGVLISNGTETLNKILTDLVKGVLSVAAAKDVPGITMLLTRINNLLK